MLRIVKSPDTIATSPAVIVTPHASCDCHAATAVIVPPLETADPTIWPEWDWIRSIMVQRVLCEF